MPHADVMRTYASLDVDAPVADVFRLWMDFPSYPHFLHGISEARAVDKHTVRLVPTDGQRGWTIRLVDHVRDRLIAWQTPDGLRAATIRFYERPNGMAKLLLDLRDISREWDARQTLERFREHAVPGRSVVLA